MQAKLVPHVVTSATDAGPQQGAQGASDVTVVTRDHARLSFPPGTFDAATHVELRSARTLGQETLHGATAVSAPLEVATTTADGLASSAVPNAQVTLAWDLPPFLLASGGPAPLATVYLVIVDRTTLPVTEYLLPVSALASTPNSDGTTHYELKTERPELLSDAIYVFAVFPPSAIVAGDRIITPAQEVVDLPAVSAVNAQATAVTLQWGAPTSPDPALPSKLVYEVVSSTVPNDGSAADIVAKGTPADTWTPGLSSLTVSALKPTTTYYFNVLVKTPSGAVVAFPGITARTAAGPAGPPQPAPAPAPAPAPTPGSGPLTLAPPSTINVSTGDSKVTLSWSLVSGATGYDLYWSTGNSAVTLTSNRIGGVTPAYSHTGLTNGTVYNYRVATLNQAGAGTLSSLATATPIALPPSPTGVSVVPGTNHTTLTWAPVMGATSYAVYWDTSPSVTTASNRLAGSLVTSPYDHTGLVNGTTYYYAVVAISGAGESPIAPTLIVNGTTAGAFLSLPQGLATFHDFPARGATGIFYDNATDKLYAATKLGLAISADSGATWATKTAKDGIPGNSLTSVGANGATIAVGTALSGVAISTDSGATFTTAGTAQGLAGNKVSGVSVVGARICVATDGGLSVSSNSGVAWTTKIAGTVLNACFIDPTSPLSVFAASATMGVWHSPDGGATFQQYLNATPVNTVFAIGNNWYIGTVGSLYVSTAGPAGLTARTSSSPSAVTAAGTRIFHGDGGGIRASNDTGLSFPVTATTANGLGSNAVTGLALTGGGQLWAATTGGVAWSADNGVSFTNITTAKGLPDPQVNAVFVNGSSVYAATNAGLAVSKDGGATFTTRGTLDGIVNLAVSAVHAAGPVVAAGTAAGLAVSADGGTTFATKAGSSGLGNTNVLGTFVVGGTPPRLYAATQSGLYLSTDGGASFAIVTMPAGIADPPVVTSIQAFGNGQDLYATTIGGCILCVSHDFGATWVGGTGTSYYDALSIYVVGNSVYAGIGTNMGSVEVSANLGVNFVSKTAGLPNPDIRSVWSDGTSTYAATPLGLGVLPSPASLGFVMVDTSSGLGSTAVNAVTGQGATIYVGTANGLMSR